MACEEHHFSLSQTKVRLNHAPNLTQVRSHIQTPGTLCYFRSTFNTHISSHQLFGDLGQGEDLQGYESKQIKPRTCLHDMIAYSVNDNYLISCCSSQEQFIKDLDITS